MKRLLFLILIWVVICTNIAFAEESSKSIEIDINSIGSAVLIIDSTNGDILNVNNEALDFYGYSKEEFLGLKISDINTLTEQEVIEAMDLAKTSGKEYFEFKHLLKNGEIKDVEVYSSIELISGEQRLFSVVHDISDRVLIQNTAKRNQYIIYLCLFLLIILMLTHLKKETKMKNYSSKLSKSYDELFNNMKEGVALHQVIFNRDNKVIDYKFLRVNKSFEEITGYKSVDLVGNSVKEVMPETEDVWIKKYGEVAINNTTISFEEFSKQINKYFKVNVYSPKKNQFITVFSDITEEKKEKLLIQNERALFKTTLLSIGDAVISSDMNLNVELMNVAAENLTGWKLKDAKGKPFCDVFKIIYDNDSKENACVIKNVIETGENSPIQTDRLLITKTGNQIPIENSTTTITNKNGVILGAVVVFRDFRARKKNLEKITYLSYHDQLTGLYNRHFFEAEVKRLDNKHNLPLSLIMLDVNGLKLTNDAFGHGVGDKLLIKVAEVLKDVCRSSDIICRIGGDEIVILLPNTNFEFSELLVKRIYKKMSESKLENITISVSLGFAVKDSEDKKMDDIFVEAEGHMYRKKLTESKSMRNNTIQVILKTLNESNSREKIHSEQVSRLAVKIGRMMNFNDQELNELETAALMHDIGKIAVSDTILNKASSLTDLEFAEIKKHPEVGYHILKSVDAYSELAEYVLDHHERWDGNGYPRGLKGLQIPLFSRIISVADAYEAMTADRPYRKAMTREEAIKELEICSGKQFDAEIVEYCKSKCWTRD